MENENLSHLAAQFFIKGTGIKKPTFFQRVILRDQIVYENGEILVEPGYGKNVRDQENGE